MFLSHGGCSIIRDHLLTIPSSPPPRATGPLPASAEPQGNRLQVAKVNDLNNTIIVCNVTNALGSRHAQVPILVTGKLSSDKEGRVHRVALRGGIWVEWLGIIASPRSQILPAQAEEGVGYV